MLCIGLLWFSSPIMLQGWSVPGVANFQLAFYQCQSGHAMICTPAVPGLLSAWCCPSPIVLMLAVWNLRQDLEAWAEKKGRRRPSQGSWRWQRSVLLPCISQSAELHSGSDSESLPQRPAGSAAIPVPSSQTQNAGGEAGRGGPGGTPVSSPFAAVQHLGDGWRSGDERSSRDWSEGRPVQGVSGRLCHGKSEEPGCRGAGCRLM